MARIGIFETEVQEVVRELVIRLAATQTVAALVRQLNETLAASGDDQRLHANRVTPFSPMTRLAASTRQLWKQCARPFAQHP